MSGKAAVPDLAALSPLETARLDMLLLGLCDWVSLADVDGACEFDNSVADKQRLTLRVIASLLDDGLMRIGDLTGDEGRFQAWDVSREEAMQRVRERYIDRYDDLDAWIWRIWFDLTDAGRQLAEQFRQKYGDALNEWP